MRRDVSRRVRCAAGLLAAALTAGLLGGCADDPTADHDNAGSSRLTVGLTYIPNIQFAPFYVAEQKGYYKDAGLTVDLRHHSASEDLFGALIAGQEDVVYAGGDEMMQARAGSKPITDIATLYQNYPVALLVPEQSPVHTARDLRGRVLGIPGPFGESYFGLLALLRSAGLTTKDVTVKNIGFTQQAALAGKKVDGAMGYVNNDAVQLNQAGAQVRAIPVGADGGQPPLVASGLGAKEATLAKRAPQIRKFLAATLRGVQDTINDPQEAVRLSAAYVAGLHDAKQQKAALAVLKATIPLMRAGGQSLGHNDPAVWSRMAQFMEQQKLLAHPVPAGTAYTNAYLP